MPNSSASARATVRDVSCTRGLIQRRSLSASPWRTATAAASVRERTSSLARMRDTCTLAVFSAMCSSRPISRLVAPPATSASTWRSRGVSPNGSPASRSTGPGVLGRAEQPQARPGGERLELGGEPLAAQLARRSQRVRGDRRGGGAIVRAARAPRPRASARRRAGRDAEASSQASAAAAHSAASSSPIARAYSASPLASSARSTGPPASDVSRSRPTCSSARFSATRSASCSRRSRASVAASASTRTPIAATPAMRATSSEQYSIWSSASSTARARRVEVAAAPLELGPHPPVGADELRLGRLARGRVHPVELDPGRLQVALAQGQHGARHAPDEQLVAVAAPAGGRQDLVRLRPAAQVVA